ncbi:MAG: glucose-6-phosphate dehydrogenase [Acidisphaera sp.]|nr:glucose-6-phosphate dehydrogenase [Acidisphaera sp.]
METAPPAPPLTLVIFGAHGDLTKRLLMPALYNLADMKLLDQDFRIIGIDHSDDDTHRWADSLTQTIHSFVGDHTAEFHPDRIDETAWSWITQRLEYVKGDFGDDATFRGIGDKVVDRNCIFYLAVAARFFGPLVERLGKAGLLKETPSAFRRVVVEKPFGRDLPSAQALNAQILKAANEKQIYRIDHFMGKETVQNILALRFCNALFEPVWRREYIDHVQIMAAETIGVEARGGFYEPTGALRDMVPNHLFTLLAMVAMEPPDAYNSDAVRDERAKVIEAIAPVQPQDAVRGQYGAGTVQGKPAKAYREEQDVARDSTTETYIALKLAIGNWRWAGVPFYLRTGKHLKTRRTEIALHFKPAPVALLGAQQGNVLTIALDPEEEVAVRIDVKTPGMLPRLSAVDMAFRYADNFPVPSRVGYEILFYSVMNGDTLLFQRADQIEAAWAVVQPALSAWEQDKSAPEIYPAGSAGPKAADDLLARDGRIWESL